MRATNLVNGSLIPASGNLPRSARAHSRASLVIKELLWFGSYLLLILFPLIVGWLKHPPEVQGRAFSLHFSTACGYVALSVMAFEFALISRVGFTAAAFGQDALLKFHRLMGLVATALVVLHAVFVFRNGYPVTWLTNPFSDGVIKWGTLAFYALILLIVLSLARKRLGLSYGWWQITHSLLANSILLFGVVHAFQIGSFAGLGAMNEMWAIYLLLFIVMLFRFRILKPVLAWQRPWEVTGNVVERGNARTLVLKPVGHDGFTFEPGQFAWINTGKTPFHRDQHPISLSSCAYDEPGREVSFTIKDLGDWSGTTVPSLKPGSRVWLDGPYGVFTADREQGPGYVLIAGGVGITPFYSMCLTFAERGDRRPVYLFYASGVEESLTLRNELDSLQERLNLTVIYILANPGADWKGETGYLTAEILTRHLPKQFQRMQYFVCGPPRMMDAMEKIIPEMGVPEEQIHTERFDMV
jgi:predicted ferric reductase